MIRINLLGQQRPKVTRQVVPLQATVQILFAVVAIALAVVVLGISFYQQRRELEQTRSRIAALNAEKASLQQIKQDVDRFESQKNVLQQRINVIETLQKNRTGGQQLLEMVANAVVRVNSLWLTSFDRSGTALKIQGEAGSIDAVANFLTAMKRSGYFDQVEIKSAKENDLAPSVKTFQFSMTAAVAASSTGPASAQPANAAHAPQRAPRGRS